MDWKRVQDAGILMAVFDREAILSHTAINIGQFIDGLIGGGGKVAPTTESPLKSFTKRKLSEFLESLRFLLCFISC